MLGTFGVGDLQTQLTALQSAQEYYYRFYASNGFGVAWAPQAGRFVTPAQQQTHVPAGAHWRYLDDGSDQGTAWRETGFNDTQWASGPAQLGYGDGDEATVVGFGGVSTNKFITTYFRHTFTVVSRFDLLNIRLLRDDGAIVYLNGSEVFRSHMPTGPVNYLTTTSGSIPGADESRFFEKILTHTLPLGTNVIAAEVHQANVGSSDMSFDLALISMQTPFAEVTRGPYLQKGSPTDITVRWRTNVPTDGRVRYGNAPGQLQNIALGETNTTEHVVALTNLTPYTRYFYALSTPERDLAGDDEAHSFVTSPLPGWPGPTRIWAIGDSGTANAGARSVWEAYQTFTADRHTDVWLLLGDNAYPNGTDQEFQRAFFDMYPALLRNTVVWPTVGNHETYNGETFSALEQGPYYNIFSLPRAGEAGGLASGTEAYYSFDYANIHFVSLNSMDIDRSGGGTMMTWLENDLATTKQEWLVAFFHHPPYTKGTHNSDNVADSAGRMRDMRDTALPILERHGVDLILSGHSHVYERSYLLNGHYGFSPSLNTNTMVIDHGDGREDGDGVYRTVGVTGTVYAVCGSSGALGSGSLDHPAMYISMSRRGSMVLDVTANRLNSRFLDNTGVIQDHFTVEHVSPTNTDTDNDDLPDWWEMWHFSDLDETPQTDPDGDGASNASELGSGTNPTDGTSHLHIGQTRLATGELSITWPAGYGWAYSVESATNLTAPVRWSITGHSNRAARLTAPMSYTNVTPAARKFLRVTVQPAQP